MCQNSFINYCSRYFYFRFHGSFLVRLLDSQVLTHRQNSLELTMNCLVLIVFKGRIEKREKSFASFCQIIQISFVSVNGLGFYVFGEPFGGAIIHFLSLSLFFHISFFIKSSSAQ